MAPPTLPMTVWRAMRLMSATAAPRPRAAGPRAQARARARLAGQRLVRLQLAVQLAAVATPLVLTRQVPEESVPSAALMQAQGPGRMVRARAGQQVEQAAVAVAAVARACWPAWAGGAGGARRRAATAQRTAPRLQGPVAPTPWPVHLSSQGICRGRARGSSSSSSGRREGRATAVWPLRQHLAWLLMLRLRPRMRWTWKRRAGEGA